MVPAELKWDRQCHGVAEGHAMKKREVWRGAETTDKDYSPKEQVNSLCRSAEVPEGLLGRQYPVSAVVFFRSQGSRQWG